MLLCIHPLAGSSASKILLSLPPKCLEESCDCKYRCLHDVSSFYDSSGDSSSGLCSCMASTFIRVHTIAPKPEVYSNCLKQMVKSGWWNTKAIWHFFSLMLVYFFAFISIIFILFIIYYLYWIFISRLIRCSYFSHSLKFPLEIVLKNNLLTLF